MQFSLKSIANALQNAIQRVITGIQAPGGYLTSPTQNLLSSAAGPFVGALGGKVTPSGKISVLPAAKAETPQSTGTAQTLKSLDIVLGLGGSPILTPTPAATPPATSKTTTTTSTKAPGAVAPAPAIPMAKPTVATPGIAPTPTAMPPTPTTPTTAKTGTVSTPPPAAGYSAPIPAGLPPTPGMPGEITQPITPENLARFEAMIRALQELAGGARYVPMPAIGAEPFGPAGALERALRRLREREVRV